MTRLNKLTFFLLCSTIILTTLAYGTVHQPLIALFYAAVVAAMMLWAADSIFSGEVRFSRSELQIPLFLLGVYALIQAIPFGTFGTGGSLSQGVPDIPRTISLEPFATKVAALHIFSLVIFSGLVLASLHTAARLRRITSVLVIFGFVYAFYAILQAVLSPDKIYGIYRPASAVPFGSFVNRHDFAAIIEMTISLPLGLIFTGAIRSDKRLLYGLAVALMASSLLLSGSRGGLVALVAEIILLVILTSRFKGRRNLILKAGLSILLAVAAIGGAIFVGGDTSLTRISETASSDDVSSNRIHIWAVTTKVIADNMPFGAGLGAFAQAYTKFDTSGGYERVEQAHNDYLQLLADAGIVGLVIGGMFLFWFFREGVRSAVVENTFRRGIAIGAFAGCFAVLIHSLFDFVLHITAISVMFVTLMGILVASGRSYSDDIEEIDVPKRKRHRSASVTQIVARQTEDKALRTSRSQDSSSSPNQPPNHAV